MTTIIEKPRNYSKGKIYKIEALNGEPDDIYIGSTTKEFLSQRMTKHRSSYLRWSGSNSIKPNYVTSFDVFDKYGILIHITIMDDGKEVIFSHHISKAVNSVYAPCSSRIEAERNAVEEAFEILNEKL